MDNETEKVGHLSIKKFPLGIFSATFLLSTIVTVFSLWQVSREHALFDKIDERHLVITQHISRAEYFDEALTMSARMAAATGDFTYEDRYNELDPELTAEIRAMEEVLPGQEQFINQINDANLALVALERQAFALTHQGKQKEALSLLSAEQYLGLKKEYADTVRKLKDALLSLMKEEDSTTHRFAILLQVANLIGVLTLFAAWILALKTTRGWNSARKEAETELEKAYAELDDRVKERTKELAESNLQREQYLQFFNLSVEPMCIADPFGRFIEVNPAFARLTGYTKEELLSKPFISFVAPEDRERTEKEMRLQTESRPSINFENYYICKDGSRVLLSWDALFDKTTGVTYAIAHDMTKAKKAELALHESEALLQSVIKILPVGLWIADATGKITFGNSVGQKIWEGARYVGIDEFHEYKGWWLNTGKLIEPHEWAVARAIEKGEISIEEEIEIECFDGSHKIILNSALPLRKEDGTISGAVIINQDITEHKKTEEQIRSASTYTRSLIEASLDPLVTINPEGKITDVNEATILATGTSREALVGSDFSSYFTEPEKARAGYQEVFSKGFVANYPLSICHTSGRIIDVIYNASVYRDTKGNVVGVFAAARDITERKTAEARAERLSTLYATLSRCNQAIVHSNNKEELLIEVCRALVQVGDFKMAWVGLVDETKNIIPIASYGDTAGYLNGIHITADENDPFGRGPTGTSVRKNEPYWCQDFQNDECTAPWHERGAISGWAASAALPLYQKGIGAGAITIYAREKNAFDESTKNLLIEMAVDISYALDTFVDKSEKRNADEALKKMGENLLKANQNLKIEKRNVEIEKAQDEAIMASLGEGMIAVDQSGKVVAINHAAEKMLGWKEEDLLGKMMVDAIPALDEEGNVVAPEKRPISIVLTTGKPTLSYTIRFIGKDGTTVTPVAVNATLVTLNNKTTGAVIVFRDITKEQELEETRRDLLSLASHQLRTPLSGTKWLIETLIRGVHGQLTAEQKDYLNEIYKINERMTTLVQDMLGVIRMESTSVLTKKDVVMRSIIESTIETLRSAATNRQITLHLPQKTDYIINTDPLLFRTLLEIFISNAIDYSNPNSDVTIDIEERIDEITLVVKDSGIGIPNDEQPHIFERFYRAANAKVFNTRGAGLGLYIASMIGKKLGIKITFESEVNKGTTFYIHIPLSEKSPLPEGGAHV